jgi:hypothetical protein
MVCEGWARPTAPLTSVAMANSHRIVTAAGASVFTIC